jgi:hypothetical protein
MIQGSRVLLERLKLIKILDASVDSIANLTRKTFNESFSCGTLFAINAAY